jgi:phosphate transport system permease protein
MTDAAAPRAVAAPVKAVPDRASAMARRLKRRHAAEARFKWYGRIAILFALGFLAVLLTRIVTQGYTAFWTHSLTAEVRLDPARVDRAYLEGTNFNALAAEGLLAALGLPDDAAGENLAEVGALLSPDLGFQLLRRVRAEPGLIGQTVRVEAPVSDDADLFYKGEIKRSTAEASRTLTDRQMDHLDRLKSSGAVRSHFNSGLFTRSDSTQPEMAGLLGAIVGSLMTLLITGLLAVPIGALAAIYLEEFAPKNRATDFIEVNINNLAAVPSIVYGLLGVAVFINWFGLPRASPLVGGMVLALMALPTVIIATRSSLKAVPPSIREAALGVGASKTQTVFHHVLPLAMPGVMTGTIIAMAHAIGETAPLLLIGMVSFVPGVPADPTSAATVLPVQIFIWENAAERGFHERTAAAIIVLLIFMILMNAAAIVMRRRFERRW